MRTRLVRPRGWAKTVTDVLSPAHIVLVLPVAVGWHATAPAASGLVWGLFSSALAAGVPYAFVYRGVRRNRLTDIHVRVRRDRYVPILVTFAAMALCLTVLILGGAPRALSAMLAAFVVSLVVAGAITTCWQISGHAAASAGAVGICAVCFGPWALAFAPLVLLISLSRWVLRDHTAAQLVAGAGLGAVLAPLVMRALMQR